MAARREVIDIPFKTPITVLVDNSFSMFTCSSYSRGYHTYKHVWHPIVGDKLICEGEETNEYDRNTVSIMFDDCILKKVVGHVLFNWRKLATKFLQFPNHHIHIIVTGSG